jgi:poly-gamma-glutamate synthesis protein (capsule biosynthesis protein)
MNNNVSIFFAGDFCSKPSTSLISVDENLKSFIKESDISIVNFEVPLKPEGVELSKVCYERFFQNDDAPNFLKSLGFKLFSVANNHLFDWGKEGYSKTIQALNDSTFGAGTYEDAYKIKIQEVDGLKIGFLAVCYAARGGVFDDVYQTNGMACAYMNDLKVNHIIIEAKKNLDYLFVLPHAGVEYTDAPIPELIARYKDFIDYGADGVIASHPHCPQGWEIYKEKPIFYSLGNFFFNSKNTPDFVAQRPHWYEGLCVKLTLSNGKISHEVINTRNIKNRQIVIDNSTEREEHNNNICDLLRDKNKYDRYLKKMIKEKGIAVNSLFLSFGNLLSIFRFIYSYFFRNFDNRLNVLAYDKTKDDDERSLYLRFMKKYLKNNFKL